MASLADIRAALAAAVGNVAMDLQVSAYMLAKPTPPCAQVVPDEMEYHQSFGSGAIENWGLLVQVMVAANSDQGSQQLLDQLLESSGALSIKAAIEADKTLGGTVLSAVVTKTSGYRTYRLGATQAEALGAEWTVDIKASGI